MSADSWTDILGKLALEDLISLVLGDFISRGQYRRVYEFRVRPEWVVKIEYCDHQGNFSNAMEYRIWQTVKGSKWEKWFAPVHNISACGSVLLQSKVEPLKVIPREVPDFFTDLKPENFGMLDGRVVACDYGNNRFFAPALLGGRVRRVRETKHRADAEKVFTVVKK